MKVWRATLAMGAASLLVAVLGMGKEMLLARMIGVSAAMDAYVLALAVVVFGAGIVAGALQTTLVPKLCEVAPRRAKGLWQESDAILTQVLWATVAMGIGCWALSLWLLPLALGCLLGETRPETLRTLANWLSPLWCTGLLSAVGHGALHARNGFLSSGLAPAAVPVGISAVLVLGGHGGDVIVLAAGTCFGAVLEVVVLGMLLWRKGVKPVWSAHLLPGASGVLRPICRQTALLVPGMAAMASAPFVDRAMASWLDAGAVSQLHYGLKVPAMVASLGGVAVASSLLAAFSTQFAAQDSEGALALLRRWSRGLLWGSVCLALGGVAVSTPVVELLYEGGEFTAADTLEVAVVQGYALLHIPFYWCSLAMARFLAAAGKNGWLSWIGGGNIVVNVLGNWMLMPWLGAAGIALSTALMYGASVFACRAAVLRAAAEKGGLTYQTASGRNPK